MLELAEEVGWRLHKFELFLGCSAWVVLPGCAVWNIVCQNVACDTGRPVSPPADGSVRAARSVC